MALADWQRSVVSASAYQLLNGGGMVFLFQVIELVQSVVDAVQLCRVEVGVLQHLAHLVGNIFQLDAATV